MDPRPDPIEARNDAIHRRVAALIRHDPTIVSRARETLERWIRREPLPAWLEWRNVLVLLEPEEIASFLMSTTPRARRMRSSSPFTSIVREPAEASPR